MSTTKGINNTLMGERKEITPISFNADEARAEIERERKAAKRDKAIRSNMRLAVGCSEMNRIVKDLLVPEFLSAVHTLRKSGIRAELIAYDAENPVHEDEMVDIGVKFRCGDRDSPCKIEFVADPSKFDFTLQMRDPSGAEKEKIWKFANTIPRNIRLLIENFLNKHFENHGYKRKTHLFDQYDEGLKAPFMVKMEEDGVVNEIATANTLQEAVKMGASFATMFKGKPMFIEDKTGKIVC